MSIPIKSEREADKMRSACRSASTVLDRASAMIRPGITTAEVDSAAADFMAEEGCKSAFLGYRGFPGNICISVNEEVVHGIGGSRRVQYGDIVKLDIGVIKNGWVGDTATTVAAKVIDEKVQRLLRVTEETLAKAIVMARNGRRLGDLCAAIEEEVVANGYSVVREFVGHGVGRKLHEEPQIPNYGRRGTGPKLQARHDLWRSSWPMVNMGGSSVRILADRWTVVTCDATSFGPISEPHDPDHQRRAGDPHLAQSHGFQVAVLPGTLMELFLSGPLPGASACGWVILSGYFKKNAFAAHSQLAKERSSAKSHPLRPVQRLDSFPAKVGRLSNRTEAQLPSARFFVPRGHRRLTYFTRPSP